MMRPRVITFSPQSGMALVVALVLLMVMTMVAVIAMRSTTLDIKMTTNNTQARRAFENSEGSRDAISPVLAAHVFYHGWPTAIGGLVPPADNFTIPPGLTVSDSSKRYDLGQNGDYTRFRAGLPAPDLTFISDVNGNGVMDPEDVNAQLWVTRLGVLPAPGNNMASNAGDQGFGGGAGSKFILFDVRSDGRAVGNARSRTGADYRALMR